MARREFLHLAHKYTPEKPPRKGYNLSGWYLSEKQDGQRCFWDGGLTRGMDTVDVPWASIYDPKKGVDKALSEVRKGKIRPKATGLWSRYGNPIMAPDWFLNGLPAMPLDGELFAGRGNFQTTMSAVRTDIPDDAKWKQIQYAVYGCPPLEQVFVTGEIKNTNFHRDINCEKIMDWISTHCPLYHGEYTNLHKDTTFAQELAILECALETHTDFAYLHKQIKLANTHEEAAAQVEEHLEKILELGGEGLIIRAPESQWYPKRMHHMLKYKPFDDDEGIVVGFTSGRETNKGSKLLGMIGALILDYNGKRLELAGLTNEERRFVTKDDVKYAEQHPGEEMPASTQAVHFKVGDTVTFKYRELSDDGIPKEARYWRQRREQ